MYQEELKRVEKRIKNLVRKKKLAEKKVYLFGVSENTRQMIRILRKYQIEPAGVMDNDKAKQGSFCSHIKVLAPGQMELSENLAVLIYSAFWLEMESQLKSMQIRKEDVYLINQKRKSVARHVWSAEKGKWLYHRLIQKYGHVPVFLCPYTGTGDIYLIGTFWKQYIKKIQIEDYIFVVVNGACKKTAMLFDIKNIEVLSRERDSYDLLSYYTLCPELVNLKILNDSWPQIHTNPIEWFRGYKSLDFTEMFRRFVFDFPEKSRPEHPVLKDVDRELEQLFKEKGLEPGNTVVLAPYSNTLADLPDEFWKRLAGKLKKAGFTVFTNSSGSHEPPIKETKAVFFSLDIAPQFVEKAGFFIGVRSGLCDIISNAKAKKIILYDAQNRFFNGSAFEYFSLKKMGLCSDLLEIQFLNSHFMDYIEQIYNYIIERETEKSWKK